MKKLLLLIFICYLCTNIVQAEKYAVIKGVVKGKYKPQEMLLMKVTNGISVKYAGTSLAYNGSFAFMLQLPKDQYCYLDDGKSLYRFYMKQEDEIEVMLSDGVCEFVGNVSTENFLLGEWMKRLKEFDRAVNEGCYATFFEDFDKLRKSASDWLIEQKNTGFSNELRKIVEMDLFNKFVDYVSRHQQKYDSEEQLSEYYREIIQKFPIEDIALLNQPYGLDLLQKYFSYKGTFVIRDREYTLDEQLSEIQSPLLKAEYVISQLEKSDFDKYCEYERKYFHLLQNNDQRFRFLYAKGRPRSIVEKGKRAASFMYQDVEGDYKSIADFSGKYKYIDIWATWCAPCKKEIPYLKKLEKKYAGKDIVFISVSIDKNRDSWEKFVKNQKLGGVQLWAGDWDFLPQELHIGSIPRFILIDKEGKWIDANALRPSNPELQEMLDELLKTDE